MIPSLLLTGIGGVVAEESCADGWCPVNRKVVEMPWTFDVSDNVSYGVCLDLCMWNDGADCQAFALDAVDSPTSVCTHYKFNKTGTLQKVFAYFPIVNLSKVLPESTYTYSQVGQPTPVTGVDQCREVLGASSAGAKFAKFGNQACGTTPTYTADIVDGQFVETKVFVTFRYNAAAEGLGAAPGSGYLTLTTKGLEFKPNPVDSSYWTWSNSGVMQISNGNPVCFGDLSSHLTPIYASNKHDSHCVWGQRRGSPDGKSEYGWIMKNTAGGGYKCMGDVVPNAKGYDVIKIEEPQGGKCTTKWEVKNEYIQQSALLSRSCDADAFDGVWVDGPSFSPGDFSRQWFDKLTISSSDNQLIAHTKEGVLNLPYSISVEGCSITVSLVKGCDTCIATGTLNNGGDRIIWDSGFNAGDYWIRKNHGCCTLFDATEKESSSSLVSPARNHIAENNPTLASSQCDTGGFDGVWVDGPSFSPGDFSRQWFDKLTINSGDNQLTAHTKEGVLNLTYPISVDGCSITVHLESCDDCIATGTLSEGGENITWDTGFNDGDYWIRKSGDDVCEKADMRYSCCDANDKTGCSFAPTMGVCKRLGGEWCCDPHNSSAVCGFEPVEMLILV